MKTITLLLKTPLALLTLFISVAFLSCETIEKRYDNGLPIYKYETIQDFSGSYRKYGSYKEWYESGQIKISGSYSNNSEDGIFKKYFKNGQLEHQGAYDEGKGEGLWIYYHENSVKSLEIEYKSGLAQGLATSWYDTGKMYQETFYNKGKKNGLQKTWNKKGKIIRVEQFNDDQNITLVGYWENNLGIKYRFDADSTVTYIQKNRIKDTTRYWIEESILKFGKNYFQIDEIDSIHYVLSARDKNNSIITYTGKRISVKDNNADHQVEKIKRK